MKLAVQRAETARCQETRLAILGGLAAGKSVKQLAHKLKLSDKTVSYHISKMYKMAHKGTHTSLVVWAIVHKIIKV
jgi:DNA-binding NarL/FixJ family response regulator